MQPTASGWKETPRTLAGILYKHFFSTYEICRLTERPFCLADRIWQGFDPEKMQETSLEKASIKWLRNVHIGVRSDSHSTVSFIMGILIKWENVHKCSAQGLILMSAQYMSAFYCFTCDKELRPGRTTIQANQIKKIPEGAYTWKDPKVLESDRPELQFWLHHSPAMELWATWTDHTLVSSTERCW